MASKNKSIVDEWLEDDNLMLLEAWARDGLTHVEIAERIGVSSSCLTKWKHEYPLINEALKKGREIIDYKVENALLKSALGFTTKEIKVVVGKQKNSSGTFEITKETITREVAPNVTACLAWLNNRLPDKWKRNRDKVIDIEEQDSDVQITIIRGNKESSEEKDEINKAITIESPKKKNGKAEKEKSNNPKKQDFNPDDWNEEDWED